MKYKLEELCEFITDGTHQTPEYCEDGGVIFLSSKDVTTRTINWDNAKHIPESLHAKLYSRLSPQKNDILLAKNGTTGVAALVDRDEIFDVYVSLAVLRPKKIIYPKYLLYAINSPIAKKQFNAGLKGIGVPNLHLSVIRKTEINVGKYEKQIRISNVLDKVSAVIELRKKELGLLDDLIRARFVELFGDPIDNSKGYPVHQLSEYITSLTSGSRGWARYCVDGGDEWFITIKNVKDCHIFTDNIQPVNAPDNAEAKRTKVQEGDLLISITADLGRTGVVTKKIAEHGAYINQHLSCIRINRDVLNPLFVAHYMESPAGKEQFIAKNQSAVKAGLNFNSINTLKLMVPPLTEQNRFIDFIEQVDKSKVKVQKALDETQKLFDSLMQQYFG